MLAEGGESMSSKRPTPTETPRPRDGLKTPKSKPGAGSGLPSGSDPDPCDLQIDVDLEGVRAPALSGLKVGDPLAVQLSQRGKFTSVVCVDEKGAIVGALSAFSGLSSLINCIRRGHQYSVRIVSIGTSSCHVSGGRA